MSITELRQTIADLYIERDKAEARCAQMKEALEFYADEDTWRVPETGWTPAGQDKGLKARTAIHALSIDAEGQP